LDQLDQKARKAPRALPVLKAPRVLLDQVVQRDHRVLSDLRVFREISDHRE
jgi:hypothetical protein